MWVTFGESFTTSGSVVARRVARTSCASTAGSWPNSMPPAFTWGHDALISSATTLGTPVRRLHTSA